MLCPDNATDLRYFNVVIVAVSLDEAVVVPFCPVRVLRAPLVQVLVVVFLSYFFLSVPRLFDVACCPIIGVVKKDLMYENDM